ncbi:MAG: RelA/SpoT domain-containing protein [Planctomycetes bacterium]|nr:RelA/SpoT domain-containing protein [Planctomycetota bacterium]
MPLSDVQIGALVEKYERERDRYEKMASTVARWLGAQLRSSVVRHLLTFRSKDTQSLRAKLQQESGTLDFHMLEREFGTSILDLAGVRVLLYRDCDLERAAALVEQLFRLEAGDRFRKDFLAPGEYRALHRVVALSSHDLEGDSLLSNLQGVVCEVQVVTLANHIWNELEHDIRYKTRNGEPDETQGRLLGALRGQVDALNGTVTQLMEATDACVAKNTQIIGGPDDLRRLMEDRVKRSLHGDFGKLFDLLDKTHEVLTRAVLDNLPIWTQVDRERGVRLAHRATGSHMVVDDVMVVVGSLWGTFGESFLEVARSWRGRRGAFATFVAKRLAALNAPEERPGDVDEP